MALLMYLNKERFRPENPLVLDTHLNDDVFMSFVDLIPAVIKRSTTTAMTAGEVEYHSFREIVDLANSWLERNPNWTVFNCETIMLYYKFNDKMSYFELRPNDSNFYIYGSEKNNVLKALRIWVKRKRGRDKQYIDVQTLNYYDILPEPLNDYGKFENLDHLLARANEMIANKEIQGNLITVESLICESAGAAWRCEPDVTLSSLSAKKIIALRLFYQENPLSPDNFVGIVDFIPCHLSGGGLFKRPKYEPFDDVISRAYVWLAENDSVRLVNLKTLDIKLKSWTEIDTKIMHYHEHGCYIRILRLAYARKAGHSSIMPKLRSASLDKDDNLPTKTDSSKQKANNSSNPITTESFNSSNSSSSNCLQQHQTNKITANIQSSNFNRNAESCYVHNEQLRNAVDKAIKELNETRTEQQQVLNRHPDDETVPANEEEARKKLLQNERLAQQAQHCTCNDNVADDENESSSNVGENNEKNDATKKISQPKKLYLNSKFFTPLRKNETIPQIQIRIHDFVNGMLQIKNLNNNINNTTVNNQAVNSPMTPTARLPSSTVDGSAMIIQQHQHHQQALYNQLHNSRRKSRAFSTQAGVNDHHLSLFANNNLDNHSNGTNSRKTSAVHQAAHHNQAPQLLVDQDVHCNVVCAETINIFCKSIEIDLNSEQNETFQYNRFGTRNGYIVVTFRIYYDCGSSSHIHEYQDRMKEERKQQAKTIKLKIEQSKNGRQMQIKHELVDAESINEHASKRKHLSNRTNESMCCIS